jgi:hypothetical protein
MSTFHIVRTATIRETYVVHSVDTFDDAVDMIDSGTLNPERSETDDESDRLVQVDRNTGSANR